MKLHWSSEYELGIGVIDNQHKRIVDYINDLEDLRRDDSPVEHLVQLFDYLIDYTESHFAFEESLMEECGYPKLAEHQRSHHVFSAQLATLRQRFDAGEDVRKELATLLMQWLLEHIKNDDRDYSDLVRQKLLRQSPHEHASWVARATRRFFGHFH